MLKIEKLQKKYGGFMLDCSMQIPEGHITGLIGQNGAGKSTTFKAVLGLIAPDAGSIEIFGKDISEFNAHDRQKLGVVLSDSGFSGYLSVKDILPFMENMYDSFDREFFASQAERFALPMNKKIKEFSTGMKAKLKVLAAVSHDAKLLILDVNCSNPLGCVFCVSSIEKEMGGTAYTKEREKCA